MVSAKELAIAFNVAVTTIYDWTAKGVLKRTPQKKYNLEDSLRRKKLWDERRAVALQEQRAQAETGAVPENLAPNMLAAYENSILLRVRAERERLALRKARAEVLDRRAVQKAVGGMLSMVRSQSLAAADLLAPRLVGLQEIDEIRSVIRSHMERMLARISAAEIVEEAAGGAEKQHDEPEDEAA
jgi:hypothetical protein